MKKIFISILLIIASFHAYCQSNNDTIPLKDMIVPSSPAFNLLDISPTSIERPATVKAFALSLANSVGESNGIPKNYAMQTAPYWLFKHPNMTIFKYNGIRKSKKSDTLYAQNVFYGLRNTSISIGTVAKDSTKTSPFSSNYIAYSIKTNILNFKKQRIVGALKDRIHAINLMIGNSAEANTRYCFEKYPSSDSNYNKCINDKVFRDSTIIVKSLNDNIDEYDKLLGIRPVFTLDLALASSTIFANNNFSDNHSYRSGGWITACYSQPLLKKGSSISDLYNAKNYINIYSLARIINEDSTTDFKTFTKQTYLDYGGRLEFEFDKLAISYEFVYRQANGNSSLSSTRNVGILQYKINDNLFLTGTFGQNFGTVNNLVSSFGLNWGLGKTSLYNKMK